MISNKEYANLVIGAGVYGESMRSYLEKETLYAEQTSLGVIQFEKPRLHTHFCYGYGMGRDYESAQAGASTVQNHYEVFLEENIEMSRYQRVLDILEKRPETVYLRKTYDKGNFVDFVAGGNGYEYKEMVLATEQDLEIIKKGVQAQLENLKKRCAAYWKRFGGSKLKTWTYWADA
jgi:hypothetical protein